jgi:hypothetical protein
MRNMLVLLLVSSWARAEPVATPPEARKWHLGVEALTDFPIQVGAKVWMKLPYRVRLSTSFGEMPDRYVDAINGIATSAGLYGDSVAQLMSAMLNRAITWRLHVGWFPFRHRGAYIELGYGQMWLDKGLVVAEVLQATGVIPPADTGIGFGYQVNSRVETLGIEIGWMWFPWRDLTLRASIGFAATVGAQVEIEPNFAAQHQQIFTRISELYLEDLIKTYFFVPTIGFAVGWRLY